MRELTYQDAENAVWGATIFGGGGGGAVDRGLALARQAFDVGTPTIASLEEMDGEDRIAIASVVGAALGPNICLEAEHFSRTIELLTHGTGEKIAGIITAEIGPLNVVNGWIQSAVSGIPVVDAPADGRAHPTGEMGLMGLTLQPAYRSCQAAAGGSESLSAYAELFAKGSIPNCAKAVREVSIQAGGLVAVARELLPVRFIREHGVPGALRDTMEAGRALLACKRDPQAVQELLQSRYGMRVLAQGTTVGASLTAKGGMDVGRFSIVGSRGESCLLECVDTYISVSKDGKRLCTFPDLILVLDTATGLLVNGADIVDGQSVVLLYAPSSALRLGGAYRDPEIMTPIERALRETKSS